MDRKGKFKLSWLAPRSTSRRWRSIKSIFGCHANPFLNTVQQQKSGRNEDGEPSLPPQTQGNPDRRTRCGSPNTFDLPTINHNHLPTAALVQAIREAGPLPYGEPQSQGDPTQLHQRVCSSRWGRLAGGGNGGNHQQTIHCLKAYPKLGVGFSSSGGSWAISTTPAVVL